jgi:hypothetical protein
MIFDIRKIQEQAQFAAVKAEGGEKAAAEVVFGEEGSPKEDNAAWVNGAMGRLEARFAQPAVKRIRMACQCGYGMEEKLQLVKELMMESSSLEEFAGSEKAKAAVLFCENGTLYLQFFFCPCPMLAEVERLDSYAWCECTTGYSKVSECRNGIVRTFYLHPQDFGLRLATPDELLGGDAATNARIARDVLGGAKGPRRDVVLLNAGAALLVAGACSSVDDGIGRAASAIDSGAAANVLLQTAALCRHAGSAA